MLLAETCWQTLPPLCPHARQRPRAACAAHGFLLSKSDDRKACRLEQQCGAVHLQDVPPSAAVSATRSSICNPRPGESVKLCSKPHTEGGQTLRQTHPRSAPLSEGHAGRAFQHALRAGEGACMLQERCHRTQQQSDVPDAAPAMQPGFDVQAHLSITIALRLHHGRLGAGRLGGFADWRVTASGQAASSAFRHVPTSTSILRQDRSNVVKVRSGQHLGSPRNLKDCTGFGLRWATTHAALPCDDTKSPLMRLARRLCAASAQAYHCSATYTLSQVPSCTLGPSGLGLQCDLAELRWRAAVVLTLLHQSPIIVHVM